MALALLAIPVASRAQTAPPTVTATIIGVSVSIWPAIVADQKGFFAEEGVKVDMISAGASARSLQQVAAGSADIGSSSMVDTIRGIGAGAKVKIFLNSLAVGTHSLIAAKNIKTVGDLRGKRVMTGGPGDITNLWWGAVARHFGLDPAKDVDLMFSGSTTARLAALVAGAIDATVLSTPQSFQAVQDGWTDLGPVAPYLGEFPMMIWHVNESWARANETQLAAFIRAHNKAVRYMSDPGPPCRGVGDARARLEVEPRRRAQDLGRVHADQGVRRRRLDHRRRRRAGARFADRRRRSQGRPAATVRLL